MILASQAYSLIADRLPRSVRVGKEVSDSPGGGFGPWLGNPRAGENPPQAYLRHQA